MRRTAKSSAQRHGSLRSPSTPPDISMPRGDCPGSSPSALFQEELWLCGQFIEVHQQREPEPLRSLNPGEFFPLPSPRTRSLTLAQLASEAGLRPLDAQSETWSPPASVQLLLQLRMRGLQPLQSPVRLGAWGGNCPVIYARVTCHRGASGAGEWGRWEDGCARGCEEGSRTRRV